MVELSTLKGHNADDSSAMCRRSVRSRQVVMPGGSSFFKTAKTLLSLTVKIFWPCYFTPNRLFLTCVPQNEATKIPGRSWARILVENDRSIQQGHVDCEEPEES